MDFDFLDYTSDHGLFAKKATGYEYVLTCVLCDKEKHLYYNTDKNKWICHSCGERGNYVRFVMVHQDIDYWAAIDLIEGIRRISMSSIRRRIKSFFEKIEYTEHKVIIPPPFHADRIMAKKYPTFFKKRRYDKEIVLRLRPMVCEKHPYENRIIFPFKCDGNESFVAYASNKHMVPKTLNPIGSNNNDLIYGYDFWKSAEIMILVEGITDVIRLIQYGYPAMALLGKEISDNRIYLIEKLYAKEIVLIFDGDVSERDVLERAEKLDKNISKKVTIAFIDNPFKDPDDLSFEEFTALYKNKETVSKFKRRKIFNSFMA